MTLAVQPAAWQSFDQWGCLWADSMKHAYRLAKVWGEPCMIWQVPEKGEPIRWVCQTEITDAIASM